MPEYDNNMSGVLRRDDAPKREGKKDRDFSGWCEIDHTEYWISGWTKTAGPEAKQPGRKFFSLSFEPKKEQAQQQAPASEPGTDDDIPF
jgi:hypothetical protein